MLIGSNEKASARGKRDVNGETLTTPPTVFDGNGRDATPGTPMPLRFFERVNQPDKNI